MLEIFKSRKLKKLGPMLTINLVLPPEGLLPPVDRPVPQILPRPTASCHTPSRSQVPPSDFSDLLNLVGKLRFSTRPCPPMSKDKLVKQIDAFIDDRKTVSNLHRPQNLSVADMFFRYLADRWRTRSSLENAVVETTASLNAHRSTSMQADTFARLLSGEFDCTDLLFYKYAKGTCKSMTGQLTLTQAEALSRRMFGREQQSLHEALVEGLHSEIESVGAKIDPEVLIDTQFFVYLAVWVFHHERGSDRIESPKLPHAAPTGSAIPFANEDEPRTDDIELYIQSIRQYREAAQALSVQAKPAFPERHFIHSRESSVRSATDSMMEPRSPTEDLRVSVEASVIEQEIQSILLEACRQFTGSEGHARLLAREADKLLQVVMTGDRNTWNSSVGLSEATGTFDLLVRKLEGILADDGGNEQLTRAKVADFCRALAKITADLIHQQ